MANFYKSVAWLKLRYEILREQDHVCALCGAAKSESTRLHVDHIRPRSKYPELELEKTNLQLLCEDCNLGKSDRYNDDWRDLNSPEDESDGFWFTDDLINSKAIEHDEESSIDQESVSTELVDTVVYPENGIYEGDMFEGMRHGQGKYIWPDSCVYEGSWHRNKRHGFGRMIYSSEMDLKNIDHDFVNENGQFIKVVFYPDLEELEEKVVGKHKWLPKDEWYGIGVYRGDWVDDKRTGRGVFSAFEGDEEDWYENYERSGRVTFDGFEGDWYENYAGRNFKPIHLTTREEIARNKKQTPVTTKKGPTDDDIDIPF